MKPSARLAALFALLILPAVAGDFPQDPLGWPAVTSTNKPWTRWWWLGSAVDKPNLTRQLEDFAKAGLGGVEICPIYGAVGAEDRYHDFLSPGWMDMLGHTTSEAKRLDLGVDMTTGTGWPFGGPQVTPDIASTSLETRHWEPAPGELARLTLPKGTLVCLRAFPEQGEPVDLAEHVKNGTAEWTPPVGKWTVVALTAVAPIQQVKRSAPGGAGNVLDPFSPAAMDRYVAKFDEAFRDFKSPMPRAQFHDSFEYYGANWTPRFLEKFRQARGYDFRDQLPAFVGQADADTVSRVRADYRETLGELHLDYLQRWHDWAKSHGEVTRNQAHGSPGNLLDHYAVSEIPETEIFRHVEDNQIPMMRFPVSAAHSNGRKLVSAESFTWLDEHFQVTPEKLKEAADFLFLSGVNHLFFHGIPYSPADAPWPGWLFYASTHMGQNGGLWRDLPAFTGYLQRCQSVLQEGKASSDVLIYYPIHDLWHNDQAKLPLFTVHNQNEWLWPTAFHRISMELWNRGVTFDYATDKMLTAATVRDGKVILGGHAYSALVLPGVKRMTPETMQRILAISAQGGTVIVPGGMPAEVPGLHQPEERLAKLSEEIAAFQKAGNGPLVISPESVLSTIASRGVRSESMTGLGLRFVRREHAEGFHYFIVNRGKELFDGVLPLAVPFQSALVLDPWAAAHTGVVAPGFSLRLEPGQSVIIRTFTDRKIDGPPWVNSPATPQTIAVQGPWKIQFLEGGPGNPTAAENLQPGTWTTLPGAESFSGTARYTTTFDLPSPLPDSCRLDLGKVAHTARVTLNGKSLGISWSAPHVVDVSGAMRAGENRLEIEVTSLAANRIADLDRRKVKWKQFHEINFVGIDYKPFDASGWPPLDSGLLGPVRLLVP